jgi:hypothetical protein
MHMKHRLESDSRLVRGLVLDHGARHPVRAATEVPVCHFCSCLGVALTCALPRLSFAVCRT